MDWAGQGADFRTTQVFTGHGSFGEFLEWIGRECTVMCHHCGALRDTAQHTLERCPIWRRERRALVAVVGRDLSLPALVSAMIGSDEAWKAVIHYCEVVMTQKEQHERVRRDENGGARRGRHLRRGAGRARYRPPRMRAHMRPI